MFCHTTAVPAGTSELAQPGRGLDCLSLPTRLALRLPGARTTLGWTSNPHDAGQADVGGRLPEACSAPSGFDSSRCCRWFDVPVRSRLKAGNRSSSPGRGVLAGEDWRLLYASLKGSPVLTEAFRLERTMKRGVCEAVKKKEVLRCGDRKGDLEGARRARKPFSGSGEVWMKRYDVEKQKGGVMALCLSS